LVRLSFERTVGGALCIDWFGSSVIDPIRGEKMV
jgi:hypothetical protein